VRHRICLQALQELRRAAATAGAINVAAVEGDRLVAVVGVRGRSLRTTMDAISEDLQRRLQEALQLSAYMGVSRPTEPQALKRAFEEAQEAASYSSRVARRSSTHHFGELGVHQLLLPLLGRPELPRYVDAELGRLLSHDGASSSALLPTLRAYVANSGRKAETARQLHIERRTLYHRLARIERIIARPLSDHDTMMRLTLALYGLDLLGRRMRGSEDP
jgi:purine catabolism regulator